MFDRIDITMTATLRPELLARTLESFRKYLLHECPCRLIINIDAVGCTSIASSQAALHSIKEVVFKYFEVAEPRFVWASDFPRAFIWSWEQATAGMVLHLEDDWELLRDMDLAAGLALFDKHPELAGLRLSKWDAEETRCKLGRYFAPWNGEFFEVEPEERLSHGISGHPTLYRGSFVQEAWRYLVPQLNPEKQFHYGCAALCDLVDKHRWGIWAKPNEPRAIADIGKNWKSQDGKPQWRKSGGFNRAWFTRWEQRDD